MTDARPKFLYKYRGGIFDRDLEDLVNSNIWAAEPKTLNDPFEVTVEIGREDFITLDLLTSTLLNLRHQQVDRFEPWTKSFLNVTVGFIEKVKGWGIFSAAQTFRDELSWAHYACSHRGFCIEFDTDLFLERELRNEKLFRVEYRDKPPVVGPLDLLENRLDKLTTSLLATKSACWKHEKEWRVVTSVAGYKGYDFRAVKGIYFGYRMKEEEKAKIMEKLQGRGISYYQMRIIDNTYNLEAVPIDDSFLGAPRYMYSVAPVNQDALYIDEDTSSHEGYEDLLRKAVEIARREPYCASVYAASPTDKGTAEDPVFYVFYMDPKGLPVTFYLSKSQIEARFATIKDL